MMGKTASLCRPAVWATWIALTLVVPVAAFAAGNGESKEGGTTTMQLSSTAFASETTIPVKFTCKGEDISPPLQWTNVPQGVKSFALLVEDPDAPMGIWIHWVYFNIPASTRSLSEALPSGARLHDGSVQGVGSAGEHRYQGPCPPSGRHRYFFKLFALDTTLGIAPSANKQRLLDAMKGHVLAEGQLMGYFSK